MMVWNLGLNTDWRRWGKEGTDTYIYREREKIHTLYIEGVNIFSNCHCDLSLTIKSC